MANVLKLGRCDQTFNCQDGSDEDHCRYPIPYFPYMYTPIQMHMNLFTLCPNYTILIFNTITHGGLADPAHKF